MIELIRLERCSECDAVQDTLDEMSVDYTVTTVSGATDDLPMIMDGDQTIGRDEIKRYLAELGHNVDEWTHFRADIEYVEGNGTRG